MLKNIFYGFIFLSLTVVFFLYTIGRRYDLFQLSQEIFSMKNILDWANFDDDEKRTTITNRKNDLQTEFRFNIFDNNSTSPKAFDKKWNSYLNDMNLLNIKTVDDDTVLNSAPVIVTAFNSHCYGRAHGLFDSLMKVYNKTKVIYVYDLGLSEGEKSSLLKNYGSLIFEIRRFPFDKYPSYVSDLYQFRWKPLVIADMLIHFHSVWWMDSAILVFNPLAHFYTKIRTNRCIQNEKSCCTYPWNFLGNSSHGIYSATDKRMYDYLPLPKHLEKNLTMGSASVQIIFATKAVREYVLRFWVLCALEKGCMAPEGSRVSPCNFDATRYKEYAGCHRQDQSAISIILAHVINFQECQVYQIEDKVLKG